MIVAIVQARMGSSRLPGKTLRPILGQPMLALLLERVSRARTLSRVVVATSKSAADDEVAAFCAGSGYECFRGHPDDVLDRMYRAAEHFGADHVVRLTADCPLLDPAVIDRVVYAHVEGAHDYTTNTLRYTYPDGLDTEVVTFAALERAWQEARLPSEREHVTPYVRNHPELFSLHNVEGDVDASGLRWTVDEPDDFAFVTRVYEALYPSKPDFDWHDVLAYLERDPAVAAINARFQRNEGYQKSLDEDARFLESTMDERYHKSRQLLAHAREVIPLGTQTFSKSITQYPQGVSPHYIARGRGSHVWDVDGNEYVDFINGLCAVTLGYCDPDIDAAVRDQLDNGVTFSLPHELEIAVADDIIDMVPCAQMVRFGKNGSDATSGAIRAARAFTGRDHVAVCGYHGWHDWYIGTTTRDAGIPAAVKALSHSVAYNDVAALEKLFSDYDGQLAAFILEPMNVFYPKDGYLERLRELCDEHGTVLVFDETITGFRYANGGAQELFGVTPDLATFGKGLANGYPVSAVTGRADVMKVMEEIFYSFTFGGETLSLAAAHAVLAKLRREPVVSTLVERGQAVLDGCRALIDALDMADIVDLGGHPTWSFLLFHDVGDVSVWEIKTLFLQEVFARGILTLGTHNMSYAHAPEDVEKLLSVYREVFPEIRDGIRNGTLRQKLRCEPLKPLFRVRG